MRFWRPMSKPIIWVLTNKCVYIYIYIEIEFLKCEKLKYLTFKE